MRLIDLYSGYDGYLEICLTEETVQGEETFRVRLLNFHFNEILSLVPLGDYDPKSVMYNFLHSEGWHDGKWLCLRLQEFYDQLLNVVENVIPENQGIYIALKEICQSTLKTGNRLFINLE